MSERCELVTLCHINRSGPVFTARRVCIARTMPWQDVCPSVRLSVCLSHAGIKSKRLYISSMFFHHRVAPPTILVFPHQTGWQYSDGDPPNGKSYYGLSNSAIFSDLEQPLIQCSRSCNTLTLNIS